MTDGLQFTRLWAEHDARGKSAETKTLDHPNVGRLILAMQTFAVRSAPGQELVVYHAELGSRSAERLALLGSLAASPPPDQSTTTRASPR